MTPSAQPHPKENYLRLLVEVSFLLVLFKAQLGEPFLGIQRSISFHISFIFCSDISFFCHHHFLLFFGGEPALKTPKLALKQPKPALEKEKLTSKRPKPALKGPSRHSTEALGELCLQKTFLNRKLGFRSGRFKSCDSKFALNIDSLRLILLNRFSAILLQFHSCLCSSLRKFWPFLEDAPLSSAQTVGVRKRGLLEKNFRASRKVQSADEQ